MLYFYEDKGQIINALFQVLTLPRSNTGSLLMVMSWRS